eukprot:GHRQ01033838.1.p1 GENE.GHRQ01033838.1~~GHRQ01033838.1.p1  ORF type:complete len:135 (+),score=16.02 GHRQ01033838.1:304-708(+)
MALLSSTQSRALVQPVFSANKAAIRTVRSTVCNAVPEFKVESTAAAVLASALLMCPAALADLNVYEAAAGGEFGIGSAQQYGEADIQGKDFSNQARALAIAADGGSWDAHMSIRATCTMICMPMCYAFASSAVQ